MNEYYLHDAPNGAPQTAAQLWRDSHTVDQLADKIRTHLEGARNRSLTIVAIPREQWPLTLENSHARV